VSIGERLKNAGAMRTVLGPPHSAGLDERRSEELRRQRELENARRRGWPELDRDELAFGRYGIVEHTPTRELDRVGGLMPFLIKANANDPRT
jgi:hypothetical protein